MELITLIVGKQQKEFKLDRAYISVCFPYLSELISKKETFTGENVETYILEEVDSNHFSNILSTINRSLSPNYYNFPIRDTLEYLKGKQSQLAVVDFECSFTSIGESQCLPFVEETYESLNLEGRVKVEIKSFIIRIDPYHDYLPFLRELCAKRSEAELAEMLPDRYNQSSLVIQVGGTKFCRSLFENRKISDGTCTYRTRSVFYQSEREVLESDTLYHNNIPLSIKLVDQKNLPYDNFIMQFKSAVVTGTLTYVYS